MEVVAKDLGVDVAEIEARVHELHEFNPMLGHRGCRLGITYPEIYEMQARAIFEAAVEVQKKAGKTVIPEIMIPLVATRKELDLMKAVVDQVAAEVSKLSGQKLEYLVGTMIELPRAALRAGEIAAGGRVLQLRHQRPDPDDVRPQPRRHRRRSCRSTSSTASSSTTRSSRSTSKASAS